MKKILDVHGDKPVIFPVIFDVRKIFSGALFHKKYTLNMDCFSYIFAQYVSITKIKTICTSYNLNFIHFILQNIGIHNMNALQIINQVIVDQNPNSKNRTCFGKV